MVKTPLVGGVCGPRNDKVPIEHIIFLTHQQRHDTETGNATKPSASELDIVEYSFSSLFTARR